MQKLTKLALTATASAFAMAVVAAAPADAKMKAKYYKECYAPVEEARELVPEPKADVGGTAKGIGSAAGAIGKIGGLGGFGGLGKVAQTAATVQQYSGYVASAAALAEQMQDQYPDPADRILAYGEQLGDDANNILDGAEKLGAAQTCYDEAYTQLVSDFEAEEIKKRAARNQHKEIQKGMIEINSVLADAQAVMDNNLQNYNEALTNETEGMGLNLSTLSQAASVAGGVSSIAGVGGGGCKADFATCARRDAALRARAAGGWGGLYTDRDPMGAAPTPPGGMSHAQFGIMNDLSMLGGMSAIGGMSGTAAAAIGGQVAMGAVSNAMSGNTATDAMPAQAQPQAVPIEQQVSPQMLASLQAAGVNSQKYLDTYGQIALTTEKQFEVSSRVGQKAGW